MELPKPKCTPAHMNSLKGVFHTEKKRILWLETLNFNYLVYF